ncbi:four helix bundle protein [Candidatus Leptofilum sp.]|uniref:four helix bundle protein n=1 Tax=Candidatus Leptofilum sp. TaxID=3241576 RepID=UPI003B5A0E60
MDKVDWKRYEEWLEVLPNCIKEDPLWRLEAYRKSLFLSDLAWLDCEKLQGNRLGQARLSQLLRSSGSISANVEEGYGRGFGKDYARFLRIAIGSARETRGWYWRSRQALEAEVVNHRMNLATEIIRMLTIIAEQQRKR